MSENDLETQIDSLIRNGQVEKVEGLKFEAQVEFEQTGNVDKLKTIVRRLAHFFATPDTKDPAKAEACFLELERISPGSYAKYQTAMFYFYSLHDSRKVIAKVDEIQVCKGDEASYYSALALKGLSLVKLGQERQVEEVLDELLKLVDSNAAALPYGDEMNFIEASISIHTFRPKSFKLLELVIPMIRDKDFQRRGKRLLKFSADG